MGGVISFHTDFGRYGSSPYRVREPGGVPFLTSYTGSSLSTTSISDPSKMGTSLNLKALGFSIRNRVPRYHYLAVPTLRSTAKSFNSSSSSLSMGDTGIGTDQPKKGGRSDHAVTSDDILKFKTIFSNQTYSNYRVSLRDMKE